jgi:hypothetical protein
MEFEWIGYYDAAQDFYNMAINITDASQNRKKQAYLRSSISRAYYAALQNGKEYLVEQNMYYPTELEKRAIHIYILDSFRLLRDPRGGKIRDGLEIIRNHRAKADYEKVFPLKKSDTLEKIAQQTLAQARFVMELIAKLK